MLRQVLQKTLCTVLAVWLTGCTFGGAALKLHDSVIEGEAIWEGEVHIDGVVTVKKGGRLTILPGTRILFVPNDVDGDGIGDAELLVEGTLSARGTAEEPIVFTSAAQQPQPADWKYLYLDFAKASEIDHVVCEYAYSGLQIHFSRAQVTNSVFRYNVDGLRFSTVNLLVAGNAMHDNQHGLRYEERNSQALIHHNDIRDNDIGIFVVTRSEDKVRIAQNNIIANRQYNVKLGWQQPGDVTLPENWWGTTDTGQILKTFLDRQVDASLGQVSAPHPLAAPVQVDSWQKEQGAAK